MANLHNVFGEYNSIIRLSDPQRQMLILTRNNLRIRIQKRHEQFAGFVKPYDDLEFQSQGSFVMDTIITHGPDACISGKITRSDKSQYRFCDIYRFKGAGGFVLHSITTFLIKM